MPLGTPARRRSESGARRQHVLHHIGVGVGIVAAVSVSLDESTVASAADIVAVLDDDLATGENGLRISLHFETFIGAVIDIHVMGLAVEGADRLLARRIKDHDIGVAAD